MSKLHPKPYHAVVAAVLAVSALLPGRPAAQACPDPKPADFKKEVLTPLGTLKEPVEMAVTKGGQVFIAERKGVLKYYDPTTNATTVAGTFVPIMYVYSGDFDVGGLLGVAVSPDFPTSDNWVYVYYAPKGWTGGEVQTTGKGSYRLSRFPFLAGKLDMNAEQVMIDIPATWQTHNGGSLNFGKDGNLFLSTGDNSCAGCNDQYSPMDERPGREYTDDQRSTANTNDLRGKILRIHPEATQTNGKYYSIPAGNLFPVGTAKTLPEIYTMGHRNPYRVHPDRVSGRLYIGEFGPASQAASARGPAGADQFKMTDEAAFLGYPYFLKDNQPYCHWNYATSKCDPIKGQTSLYYDPAKPVNTSPNNTGLEILPPAKPAVLWEHDGPSADPIAGLKACGLGGGPVYHYSPTMNSKVKFPPYFENKWIVYAIYGGWQPKLAVIPTGAVAPIKQMLAAPWTGINFSGGLHDIEFGPGDGALYFCDYGGGMYMNNGDAGLIRITYGGCLPASTAVLPRLSEKAARGFVNLQGPETRSLKVPAGAQSVVLLSLNGKKVWESMVDNGQAHLTLPTSIGNGMLRIRWN
jgi:cytochrome c